MSVKEVRARVILDKRKILAICIEISDSNYQSDGVHDLDTELARTFLTVIETGSFISAAERIHVTQSTVSARIHSLEDQFGCALFVRNKAGTTLTPAGRLFQKHASVLVRAVEQARHDIGVPRGFRAALTVGGRFGLWEQFLLKWLPLMRERAPHVAVRAEICMEAELMQGLVEGRVDIAVMYTPQSRPGLKVELLFEEKLVLVATDPNSKPEPCSDYVHIDWGPEFHAKHSAAFPDVIGPGLTANIGWLGLRHILENGGSGYFPARLVRPYVKENRLTALPSAPAFSLPAYVVYPDKSDPDLFNAALTTMREQAAAETCHTATDHPSSSPPLR